MNILNGCIERIRENRVRRGKKNKKWNQEKVPNISFVFPIFTAICEEMATNFEINLNCTNRFLVIGPYESSSMLKI